ncbi:hypothetical protein E2C01_010429 [Portunus trituberculatus]|uniref:Uncharacterized protein n=1 Tax=Portunus trituberculatus TaxID=210409 RepID=A0A5B7D8N9_PORTR|nr:hypothetical protein [Portunus trituberculatus]
MRPSAGSTSYPLRYAWRSAQRQTSDIMHALIVRPRPLTVNAAVSHTAANTHHRPALVFPAQHTLQCPLSTVLGGAPGRFLRIQHGRVGCPALVKWRWREVTVAAAGALNIGVAVASVAVSAVYHDRCLLHPRVPFGLAMHGAAQVVAVFGLGLGADVTEQLQYRLYRARLRQRGRRNKKKSFLYRKEHRVYKSLSVDNVRRKTFGFIPDERAMWFCCISCEPIVRGHANLPPKPPPIPKLSPEFEDRYKHPPGWAWLCWLRGLAGLIYMFLALPILEIGIIYLRLCSPHYIVPGWLLWQGAISTVCLATLFPIYCLPLKLGTKLFASLRVMACILAVAVVVWPPLGLLSVLAGWRERQDIILNTLGYCDPEFQLFTVVVAAILSLPLTCLLYAACLLLIAMVIVGIGILLFWGCCDEDISSDVGMVTRTHAKISLSSAECNGHTTRLNSQRGSGTEGEEWGYDRQSMGILPIHNGGHL